jgi:putative endopeptidase
LRSCCPRRRRYTVQDVPSPLPVLVLVLAASTGCATSHPCVAPQARAKASTKQPKPGQIPEPPDPKDLGAHVHAAMSCNVDPCQDFYDYACGGYLDELQSGRSERYLAAGFAQIHERNRVLMHGILLVAAETMQESPERRVLGEFFGACMAQERPSSPGLESLMPQLGAIDEIGSRSAAMSELAELHRIQVDALFGLGVAGDPRRPENAILAIWQPGSTLAIEHLRGELGKSKQYVQAYRAYMQRLFEAAGTPPGVARSEATAVLELEQRLATRASTAAEAEADFVHEVATISTLAERYPGFPWLAYAATSALPPTAEVLFDERYIEHLAETFAETELGTLRAYLRWRALSAFAADGSPRTRQAQRWFEGTILHEIPEEWVFAQWGYCVDRANAWLPELLGQYYVQLELPPHKRSLASEIAELVRTGFAERIEHRDWLDPSARAAALEKLSRVTMRIGHPDSWRDYSAVRLDQDDHLRNIMHLAELELEIALYSVGRKRDAEAWPSSPVDANAWYEPSKNTVAIAAGILQWPLFRAEQPMVVNLGGIGAIAGHELGHAFDRGSIDRDADGRQRPWLDGAARSRYDERVQCVVRDLGERKGEHGTGTIGQLARDEAIADLAGVHAAHRAWRAWQADHHSDTPAIPGLTDDQLFFLSFAQAHCRNGTAAYERVASITDTHAQAAVRVNATLAHVPEFAEAFACDPGTPLHPPRTCEVW